MIKGDLRKKQILETAEELFFDNGYETTSVQNILDILHLSKGSFYHHYESKEQLLRLICENRAKFSSDRFAQLPHMDIGISGLNQVFSAMIPFNGEGLSFLKLILPVFSLPEGRSIREGYQEALKEAWLPIMVKAMTGAMETGEIYCDAPEIMSHICIDLINDLWYKICLQFIQKKEEKSSEELMNDILNWLSAYRSALENILTAPYGSLELMQLSDINSIYHAVRLHHEASKK